MWATKGNKDPVSTMLAEFSQLLAENQDEYSNFGKSYGAQDEMMKRRGMIKVAPESVICDLTNSILAVQRWRIWSMFKTHIQFQTISNWNK